MNNLLSICSQKNHHNLLYISNIFTGGRITQPSETVAGSGTALCLEGLRASVQLTAVKKKLPYNQNFKHKFIL